MTLCSQYATSVQSNTTTQRASMLSRGGASGGVCGSSNAAWGTRRGLVGSEWGTSENNRRAKFYHLTAAGRRKLGEEMESWNRLVAVMATALKARPEEG